MSMCGTTYTYVPPEPPCKHMMSSGSVAGLVIGMMLLTVCLTFGGMWLWQRHKERRFLNESSVSNVMGVWSSKGAVTTGATSSSGYTDI
jgi:hypothetical protein